MTEVLDDVTQGVLRNSTELTSNSLAIVTWIEKVAVASSLGRGGQRRRRLLGWVMKRREYLEVLEKDEKVLRRKADVVVAKDGSGKYKTIGEALKEVPKKSKKKRFVIYVKKGVYKENVRVEKNMWNVVMVGDGMDATVVTGSRNVVDGTPTFSTATFAINLYISSISTAVLGKGFIARDMGFINTAGPSKHQAVALMCNGDMSVFYRCNFDAFQDTLYPHANRQFYSHCNISGTVDFIFGNSAVIIQNSNILPKVPMKGQKNTITAQGKTDPNQNTGIVVHNCNVVPYRGNWKGLLEVKNFLGRPWKDYSTTVFMRSMIGSIIDPKGWLPWTGAEGPDSIYYSEYENYGEGASIKNRVKWKGVKSMDKKQAEKFEVKRFIQGDKWIQGSGVAWM
ncbi:Probable pectinesterase/pectinesterase inhibitor 46 [Linum perenne]